MKSSETDRNSLKRLQNQVHVHGSKTKESRAIKVILDDLLGCILLQELKTFFLEYEFR
jgi:hypothetical protein